MGRPLRTGFAVLKALLLVGCNLINPPATPPVPPPTEPTQVPHPPDAPSPEPGWELIAPGAERKFVQPPNFGPFASVVIHRFDPTLIRFSAHYSPSAPLWISDWHSQTWARSRSSTQTSSIRPAHRLGWSSRPARRTARAMSAGGHVRYGRRSGMGALAHHRSVWECFTRYRGAGVSDADNSTASPTSATEARIARHDARS
ncbi:MAG: hypothetical protein HND48_14115 [Chloroflexi bacterium]|nr:hypothetical protein [Chloroflexota bacterium]